MTASEIRILRRSKGLTQQQFADLLGVTKGTVARWETNKVKPSPLAIKMLIDIQVGEGVAAQHEEEKEAHIAKQEDDARGVVDSAVVAPFSKDKQLGRKK